MPKKRKEIDIQEVIEDPTYTVDPDDEEIDLAFADLPQNEPCIELFRTSKVGGRPVFLEQIAPSQFSLSYVAEKFGGGNYVARSRYKDGRKIRASFEVEGEPFVVKRVVPNPAMAPMQQTPAPAHHAAEGPIILDGADPNQAMVQLVNVMLKRMETSETAFLEKMKLYKEIFGTSSKETPLDTALSMFQKGLEMAAMNGGEGASPWLLFARELKEPLSKILDTVQVALARQPVAPGSAVPLPTRPAPAPGAGPTTQPAASPEPISQESIMLTFVKQWLPALVTAAAKNADPAVYVDFVLDQVPGSAYPQLREWLSTEGCLEALCRIEPGIRYQSEWWTALRSGILDALNQELGHAAERVQSLPSADATTGNSASGAEVG